jgi:putative aldouronate transport system substrate-binding protein
MNRSRFIALILALLMVAALFAACSAAPAGTKESAATSAQTSAAASVSASADAPVVNFAFFCTAVIPKDIDKVEAAMNKYALEKVGVGVKLIPLSIGTYNDQINLMITGGEKLDIFNMFASDFSIAVNQSKLYPLTSELIDQNAPGVKKALGDYMKGTTIAGKTYGFGVYKDMAAARGVVFNKKILDKYGYSFKEGQTLSHDELAKVFEKVHAAEPDINMCSSEDVGKSVMDSAFATYDDLGDFLGVLLDFGQSLKVENLYESDWYKQKLAYIRDWYKKGYILSDNSINPDTGLVLYKAEKTFGQLGNGHMATGAVVMNMTGLPSTGVLLEKPLSTTATINGVVMGIPSTCKDPVPALKILNLLYSDENFVNMISWGLDGVHYKHIDGTKRKITYADGVTADNSGYAMAAGWEFGNQMLNWVWENEGGDDYYDTMVAFNNSAMKSKACGFTFDSTAVKTEVAALQSVLSQYRLGLENGEMDPDVYLPQFQKALKDAGIDKVIAEKQKQLDAWAAANGVS